MFPTFGLGCYSLLPFVYLISKGSGQIVCIYTDLPEPSHAEVAFVICTKIVYMYRMDVTNGSNKRPIFSMLCCLQYAVL